MLQFFKHTSFVWLTGWFATILAWQWTSCAAQEPTKSLDFRVPIEKFSLEARGLSFSADGKILAIAVESEAVFFNCTQNRKLPGMTLSSVQCVAVQSVKNLAAVGCGEQRGRGMNEVVVFNPGRPVTPRTIRNLPGVVTAVAFSPNGRMLAFSCRDGTLKLWDVNKFVELQTLEAHSDGCWSLVFSPDGKILTTAGGDGRVKLWNVPKLDERHSLQGHEGKVGSVAFSRDGKLLVSGGGDGTVRIWDSATGASRRTIKVGGDSIASVAFSRDGNTLASAAGQVIQLWATSTGVERRKIDKHKADVLAVAFSPDGRLFASAGRDGKVNIWNAPKLIQAQP